MAVAFAGFVSLFAFDVFGAHQGVWETTLALLTHLVPTTGVVLAALVVAWRWEWAGALLFTTLGILYLTLAWGRFDWTAYLAISGPLILTGVLFLINWYYKPDVRARS